MHLVLHIHDCGVFTDDLIPLILVELVFVVSVSPDEASRITNTIDVLIRKYLLPEKSNVRYDNMVIHLLSISFPFNVHTIL